MYYKQYPSQSRGNKDVLYCSKFTEINMYYFLNRLQEMKMCYIPHNFRKWRCVKYPSLFTEMKICNIPHYLHKMYYIPCSVRERVMYYILQFTGKLCCTTVCLSLQETKICYIPHSLRERNMYYIPYSLQELRCILSLTAYGKLYVALFIYPTVYRKGRCSISPTVYWKRRCSISLTVHKKQRCSISLTVYWKRRYSQFTDN